MKAGAWWTCIMVEGNEGGTGGNSGSSSSEEEVFAGEGTTAEAEED